MQADSLKSRYGKVSNLEKARKAAHFVVQNFDAKGGKVVPFSRQY
jgi:hypothetical protein